ncbi:hypothetical protein HMPREF0262_03113 [Clostridium sp. ATCC 29733]|nr:hypothetical protein HMPREF0262_03113 [Clostridium sp. ATCC 29733]
MAACSSSGRSRFIRESKDKFKTLQKARRTSKEGFFTPLSQL